jgi:hypothetical protein
MTRQVMHLALAVLVASQAHSAVLQNQPQPSSAASGVASGSRPAATSFLDAHLLVTWYGNPNSSRMGVLGQATGDARAAALREQADAYRALSSRTIQPAYHLVAIVAQADAGRDGMYRGRESAETIEPLLAEAREHGFHLILDVQPGRAPIGPELEYLRPFLKEPDVHLGIDPEWVMTDTQEPGKQIGQLRSDDINHAIDMLEGLIEEHQLPRKVLILYQFTLGMLPDKENIRSSEVVELALVMDGIGSQALKRSSWNAVMRQGQLDYAGFKIFYNQDTNLFSPEEVLDLEPKPVVISYQ